METSYQAIILVGPQGSGKGTQGALLADKLQYHRFVTGDFLRSLNPDASELNKKIRELINKGVLLSDELLLEAVGVEIERLAMEQGIVFDGVPRRLNQAEFLIDKMHANGKFKISTIHIDLSDEECIKRLLLRAQHQGRIDDTEEGIKARLSYYKNDTIPMLEYLKLHTDYFWIDGDNTVEKVFEDITKAIL